MEHRFVHLHLHTEYSMVDSVVRIRNLVSTLLEQGIPAVAVTWLGQCF
jgi:DNA polymerase-3 subunit alpha